jgi:hypothetical protein
VGADLKGPPPLGPTGIVLRRDMTFWHEGVQVTHPRLFAAFLRGVRWLPDEGCFVIQLGRFRGQIEVEDVPFWVTAFDADAGEVKLSDGSSEPLAADSITADSDEVLRCTVKGRFPARFTQRAQAELLAAVDADDDGLFLRMGARRVGLPGLAERA